MSIVNGGDSRLIVKVTNRVRPAGRVCDNAIWESKSLWDDIKRDTNGSPIVLCRKVPPIADCKVVLSKYNTASTCAKCLDKVPLKYLDHAY